MPFDGGTTISSWTRANSAVRRTPPTPTHHGGHARYVGRIGALAVALGIGLASGDPTGLAWATPDEDATTAEVGTETPADDTGSTPGTPSGGTTSPESPSNEGSSQVTSQVGPDSSPPVTVSSTGGANTSINGETNATATQTASATADPPEPEPAAEPPAPVPTETLETVPPAPVPPTPVPQTLVAPTPVTLETTPEVSSPDGGGSTSVTGGDPRTPRPSTRPRLRLATNDPAARGLDATTAAAPAGPTQDAWTALLDTPAPAIGASPYLAAGTVLGLVAKAGIALLAPFLVPGTGSPVAPPLVWTVLAWVRREFDAAVSGVADANADPRPNAQLSNGQAHRRGVLGDVTVAGHGGAATAFADGGTRAAHTTFTVGDSSTVWATTITVVDTTTGRQVGDPVDVGGRWHPGSTLVTHDGARTLQITTIGDAPVRLSRLTVVDNVLGRKAGQTTVVGERIVDLGVASCRAALTTDVFDAVTGETTTRLRIVDTATGARVGDTIDVPGRSRPPLAVSADGTRLLLGTGMGDTGVGDTATTHVALVDLTSGRRIGAALELAGDAGRAAVSADGAWAVRTTSVSDGESADAHVTVIDAATGSPVGEPLILVGQTVDDVAFTPDGSRITLQTHSADADVTRLAVADSATGDLMGDPVEVDGRPTGVAHALDGSRVAVTTYARDAATGGYANRMSVADTATGSPIGEAGTVDQSIGRVSFVAGVDRAIVVTDAFDAATGAFGTNVTVFDVANGSRVADTLVIAGLEERTTVGHGGTAVAVTTYAPDPETGAPITTLVLLDAVTGTQIGDPVEIAGLPGEATFSPRGTRVTQTATTADGHTTRAVVVDTSDGTRVGGTLVLDGEPIGSRFSDDDARLTYAAQSRHADDSTTTRYVIVGTA